MMKADRIPTEVRYIKNGKKGAWWNAAKQLNQLHCGWKGVPGRLLESRDLRAIRALPVAQRGDTQDFNALCYLIDRPSRFIWITFEEGFLWWCTVKDSITVNPTGESKERGHFWLTCDQPWQCESLAGRALAVADLPGTVTSTAAFKRTVCEPRASAQVLRRIRDDPDSEVLLAASARESYEQAIQLLLTRLSPKDFELLVDLLLARAGWSRLAKLGGATEGVDVEVESPALGEIAFVQVKSAATQATLNDYVRRFQGRRRRYARMIFVVHSPEVKLMPPADLPVQVWTGPNIANLVVRYGLGDWVASRL